MMSFTLKEKNSMEEETDSTDWGAAHKLHTRGFTTGGGVSHDADPVDVIQSHRQCAMATGEQHHTVKAMRRQVLWQ